MSMLGGISGINSGSCSNLTKLLDDWDENEEDDLSGIGVNSDKKASGSKNEVVVMSGEWTEMTCGGNMDHATWRRNPQIAFSIKDSTSVTITLTQHNRPLNDEEQKAMSTKDGKISTNRPLPRTSRAPSYLQPVSALDPTPSLLEEGSSDLHTIGFYVFKRQGLEGCNDKRLVVFNHFNFVCVSPFRKEKSVSVELTLPLPNYPYIISPMTAEPGQLGHWSLKIESDITVAVESLQEKQHFWHEASHWGKWKGDTAGGCRHYITWRNNPQYVLHVTRPTTLIISLSQFPIDFEPHVDVKQGQKSHSGKPNLKRVTSGNEDLKSIGFYIAKKSTGFHVRKLILTKKDLMIKTLFTAENQVSAEIVLEPAEHGYRIIPATFYDGAEASFNLCVFSDHPVGLQEVKEKWIATYIEAEWPKPEERNADGELSFPRFIYDLNLSYGETQRLIKKQLKEHKEKETKQNNNTDNTNKYDNGKSNDPNSGDGIIASGSDVGTRKDIRKSDLPVLFVLNQGGPVNHSSSIGLALLTERKKSRQRGSGNSRNRIHTRQANNHNQRHGSQGQARQDAQSLYYTELQKICELSVKIFLRHQSIGPGNTPPSLASSASSEMAPPPLVRETSTFSLPAGFGPFQIAPFLDTMEHLHDQTLAGVSEQPENFTIGIWRLVDPTRTMMQKVQTGTLRGITAAPVPDFISGKAKLERMHSRPKYHNDTIPLPIHDIPMPPTIQATEFPEDMSNVRSPRHRPSCSSVEFSFSPSGANSPTSFEVNEIGNANNTHKNHDSHNASAQAGTTPEDSLQSQGANSERTGQHNTEHGNHQIGSSNNDQDTAPSQSELGASHSLSFGNNIGYATYVWRVFNWIRSWRGWVAGIIFLYFFLRGLGRRQRKKMLQKRYSSSVLTI